MNLTKEEIVRIFPIKKPYNFIDEIISVDQNRIVACYQFKKDELFFSGHFPNYPVVPGAILLESAAQVGLLAFGMFLLGNGLEILSEITGKLLDNTAISLLDIISNKDILSDLLKTNPDFQDSAILSNTFYLTSSDLIYRRVVRPGDRIIIFSEKIFFRLNKLKCKVKVETSDGELVCKGIISGIVVSKDL
jgi:3-hydroxyacyl-[acyl-carrier-protein] dehydratase